MRAWLGSLLLLVFGMSASAQSVKSDAQVLAEANAAFDQGVQERTLLLKARRQFALAADGYHELHHRGIRSAALYANLAHAAALADRKAEALWACHLGLRLDPNHSRLRNHLTIMRGKVLYPAALQGRLDADAWPPWLHRPTLYELNCISVLAYSLACLLGSFAFARSSQNWTWAAFASLLIAAIAGVGVWHEWRRAEIDRDTPLVIIAENTPLYRGNAFSYPHHPALATLYTGMEVRQIHRRGQWLNVRLTTGEVGWLPRSSVLIVEP